ncbi:MAG: RNA 2',3'-cyclic phosphodiesterase [Acidiferrobacterales bacterium]
MPDRDTANHPSGQAAKPRTQRLFLALWPDQRLRDELYVLTPKTVSGRKVARDNLHATLVFLGAVDSDTRAYVERVASSIRTRQFMLVLDQLVFRPRQRLLWVSASHIPGPLAELVESLQQGLGACGLAAEARAFSAHATLARKVSGGVKSASIDPICWNVDRFVLVESSTHASGAVYTILRAWKLSG